MRRITHDDGSTVIEKVFLTAGEGWVREASALSLVGTPALLAESAAPPTIVMADLGASADLAALLLGSDPDAAADAVAGWAEAIGRLHVATAGRRTDWQTALDERAGDLPVAAGTTGVRLVEAADVLAGHAAELGIGVPTGELTTFARHLPDDGETAALSPGDSCPDNNVVASDGVRLLDFEGAEWRHVAWDVAYLTVPWPSCWCSWLLPDDVVRRAVDRYRETVRATLPTVGDDAFERDLAAAGTAWALLSTSWLLARALAGTPLVEPRPGPTLRSVVLHRLSSVADVSPLAAAFHETLVRRWGPEPVPLAPAFRGERRGTAAS